MQMAKILGFGMALSLLSPGFLGANPWNQSTLPNLSITLRVALVTFRNVEKYTLSSATIARVTDPAGKEIATLHPGDLLPVRCQENAVEVSGVCSPYVVVIPQGGTLALSDGVIQRSYRGWVQILPRDKGLLAINLVSLEAYVAGVLGAEMPPNAPLEALKAQAVAIRSFAVARAQNARHRPYDLEDTSIAQVYPGVRGETPATIQATTLTANEILLYENRPALTLYHTASGGITASASEVFDGKEIPYLRSINDRDMAGNPYEGESAPWVWEVTKGDLASLLSRAGWQGGEVLHVRVLERGESGRVIALHFLGSTGELVLSKRAIRDTLGPYLLSTLFEVESTLRGWRFQGRGRGHGVGMSQLGAIGRAEKGQSYLQILQAYYPNTAVVKVLESPLLLARGAYGACRFLPVFP